MVECCIMCLCMAFDFGVSMDMGNTYIKDEPWNPNPARDSKPRLILKYNTGHKHNKLP
uniref:Uncharacterized protein n=1 Tax=Romanomermis culicivorax TaxID=13658 RepID=A0A915KIE0_ROMCU